MTTVARLNESGSAHWYTRAGIPCHEVPKAKGDGMRATTLADARKMGLLPSVTSILKILDKPQLTSWKIEQSVLACLTAPRLPDESDDDFVHRVLQVESQQDQERDAAADLGTRIHDAIDKALNMLPYDKSLKVHVEPVVNEVRKLGLVVATERVVVGDGYAGRVDCITDNIVFDFKTCKEVPKQSYVEAKMQLSAYCKVLQDTTPGAVLIRAKNIYISKSSPGSIGVLEVPDWREWFECGFNPLLQVWQQLKNYRPDMSHAEQQMAVVDHMLKDIHRQP